MRELIKKTALLVVLISLIFPNVSLAAGTTSIDISNKSPKVGDSFTVKVSASESAPMTISYNSEVIEFVGSDVNAKSTSSHSVEVSGKNVSITFKAKKEGSSGVIVESSNLTGSSITVPVSSNGSSASTEANTEEAANATSEESTNVETTTENNTENESETATAEAAPSENTTPDNTSITTQADDGSDFMVDGVGYVVSERYKKEEIPSGFGEHKLEINGKKIKGLSNGTMTLVYLKPASDTSGSGVFYILNSDTSNVEPLVMLGSLEDYVIFKYTDERFTESLVDAYFTANEIEYQAFQIENAQSEFYYVYGVNNQGVEGWYAYDSTTGDVSRADVMSLSMISKSENVTTQEPIDEPTEESKDKSFSLSPKFLFIAIIAFIVILMILILVNIIIKRKEDDDYYGFDDEEDYSNNKNDEPVVNRIDDIIDNETKTETPPVVNIPSEPVQPSFSDRNDELIDEIIKKASDDTSMDIMDLDDL